MFTQSQIMRNGHVDKLIDHLGLRVSLKNGTVFFLQTDTVTAVYAVYNQDTAASQF